VYESAPKSGSDGRATASLILGLAGLLLWCCPLLGLGACGVGLVLGILSANSENRGMAIAGIVLNAVGLLLSLANAVLGALMAIAGG
jgi:hypothetical protein